ncbi:SRPBCC family protein [Plantactinospora mayteni]|uniref:Activator of HSP90 ATPase n=1 Tax=Plantactinospora mayteni TaxID=566021 RepID=A0ABQ4EFU7_9ACTN|nr:SRPBCC family protein [Plantactinospora mayteni]GIG93596.1 activator of HSP90 ATPase [Plantactinospora mayteni]
MRDIVEQVKQVHRTVGRVDTPDGEARTVVLRRAYPAPVEEIWSAVTDPERIGRWFLPVSGDLRLGGNYRLTDNAEGEILRCEPPHLFRISWIYEGYSEVEVRLAPGDGTATILELEHSAVYDPQQWAEYGPGAGGVGWDIGLLTLDRYLRGELDGAPEEWEDSPEAKEFARLASDAWGTASIAAGTPAEEAARMVTNTTAFYAPDPNE